MRGWVGVNNELMDEIIVKYVSGQEYLQKVVYEWVLSKCSKCQNFGHNECNCKATQQYRPKVHTEKMVHELVNVAEEQVIEAKQMFVAGADRVCPLTPVGGQQTVSSLSPIKEEGSSAMVKSLRFELYGATYAFGCSVGRPWILAGDFNAIMDTSRTSGDSHPPAVAMKEFNECLEHIDVTEMTTHGCLFTWNPNWKSKEVNARKLDYVFCNKEWLIGFP
ncbi:hypothetical protein LIER_16576 [Lithospermum erythrorhizon]|uniref:Uncharacterized protein n=1 Tax=Lithospermum erythrorhizon TaxID=34254 RepID=A0AAV3Q9Q3_LITER